MQQYEEIVSNHQQYSKAVMEAQEWFDATHNTVLLWGDTDLERISLHTNLERLKVSPMLGSILIKSLQIFKPLYRKSEFYKCSFIQIIEFHHYLKDIILSLSVQKVKLEFCFFHVARGSNVDVL